MKITPTLNFGGQCREAIHLYEKAFGGKISCLITYKEANDPAYMPFSARIRKIIFIIQNCCLVTKKSS